ncbi:MAG: hypothetical protein IKR13_00920, partial [Victivallales bacterium]|nr:hypothetical protein [Victivallales bacterium]
MGNCNLLSCFHKTTTMPYRFAHVFFFSLVILTLAAFASTPILTLETEVKLRTPATDTMEFQTKLVSSEDGLGLRFTTPKYPGSG